VGDQTFRLQAAQCLPNRRSTQSNLLGQLDFAQPLARFELAVLDCPADMAVCGLAAR
jgi:hypothetical protein